MLTITFEIGRFLGILNLCLFPISLDLEILRASLSLSITFLGILSKLSTFLGLSSIDYESKFSESTTS